MRQRMKTGKRICALTASRTRGYIVYESSRVIYARKEKALMALVITVVQYHSELQWVIIYPLFTPSRPPGHSHEDRAYRKEEDRGFVPSNRKSSRSKKSERLIARPRPRSVPGRSHYEACQHNLSRELVAQGGIGAFQRQ